MPIKTSEPFGISQSICTRTLRNLTRYLHRNPPEPHQASSPPKPSGTSQGLCTGTFWNLTRYLPRNPPEPHYASSPTPSGTSSGSCTGNLRNLTRYLSSPEPSGTSRGTCPRTLRNLVRNLVKLHKIAPELIWAKDPIAKFFCWTIKIITSSQRFPDFWPSPKVRFRPTMCHAQRAAAATSAPPPGRWLPPARAARPLPRPCGEPGASGFSQSNKW